MKKGLLYLFIISLFLFITSCETLPSYEIVFDSDGGSVVETQVVFKGSHGVKPINPTKEGYIFAYWSLDGEEYDFTRMIVSNLTLVAVWETMDEHNHRYTSKDIKPTCSENGYTEYTCACGDTYKSNYIDKLEHSLKENPGKEPTETEFGWDTYYTCIYCDYSTYVEIPALGTDPVIEIYAIDGVRYFNYGEYPQSKVTDTELINELNKLAYPNELGYYEYNGEEYHIDKSVATNKREWFKVEPIAWRILYDNKDGSYLVISRYILDACTMHSTPTLFSNVETNKIIGSYCKPSVDLLQNSKYGFNTERSEDPDRTASCTDYAIAKGGSRYYWSSSYFASDGSRGYLVTDKGKIWSDWSSSQVNGYRPSSTIKIK